MIYKNNYLNTALPPTSRTNSNAKAIAGTNKVLRSCFFMMDLIIKFSFHHYELNADNTKSKIYISHDGFDADT